MFVMYFAVNVTWSKEV